MKFISTFLLLLQLLLSLLSFTPLLAQSTNGAGLIIANEQQKFALPRVRSELQQRQKERTSRPLTIDNNNKKFNSSIIRMTNMMEDISDNDADNNNDEDDIIGGGRGIVERDGTIPWGIPRSAEREENFLHVAKIISLVERKGIKTTSDRM